MNQPKTRRFSIDQIGEAFFERLDSKPNFHPFAFHGSFNFFSIPVWNGLCTLFDMFVID